MTVAQKRPEFRNINALRDLPTYRLPAPGWVSILHRVSGVLMFVLLPFIIWMFDTSISSELSFARFRAAFNSGLGFVPGWFVKLVALALIWAYLHHFIAGVRHVWMDVSHKAVSKQFGGTSARVTLVAEPAADRGARRQAVRPLLIPEATREHQDMARQLRIAAHRRRRALRHARLAQPARHRRADGAVHPGRAGAGAASPAARSATTSGPASSPPSG